MLSALSGCYTLCHPAKPPLPTVRFEYWCTHYMVMDNTKRMLKTNFECFVTCLWAKSDFAAKNHNRKSHGIWSPCIVIAEREAPPLFAWAGCQWILIFFLRGQGSRNFRAYSQADLIQNKAKHCVKYGQNCILGPTWSILTIFDAKTLFLALFGELFPPISSLWLHFFPSRCQVTTISRYMISHFEMMTGSIYQYISYTPFD